VFCVSPWPLSSKATTSSTGANPEKSAIVRIAILPRYHRDENERVHKERRDTPGVVLVQLRSWRIKN
jgi:hypothetical protein